MTELEIFLWLAQAPNSSMQISRIEGATKKASRKLVHDKDFYWFVFKPIFFVKMLYFLKQMCQTKNVLVNPSPKYDKVFLTFGQKGHFLPNNGGTTKTIYKP